MLKIKMADAELTEGQNRATEWFEGVKSRLHQFVFSVFSVNKEE